MADPRRGTLQAFDRFAPHVHWFVRAALAGIFLFHGYDKISNGTPPDGPLEAMFFGSATLFWLVALGEVVAGAGFVLGGLRHERAALSTRVAGGIVLVIMLGAARFHLSNGAHPWHFMQGGAEFQVLTAAIGLLALVRGRI